MKKAWQIIRVALGVLAFLSTIWGATGSTAQALSGSEFNRSRIIDDGVYFNPGGMSAFDIQRFLEAKVPVCDTNGTQMRGSVTRAQYATSRGYPPPYTCMKDYRIGTPATSADSYCRAIAGGNRSAAEIIYEVAIACSVSPKALLTILQKEQALVTDSWPWSVQYQKATGYGCPAGNCDPQFGGFFSQVYYAGRQYQRYAQQPQLFNHRLGRASYVPYHSNAACGGTQIYMESAATAGIYNYDPFQPNQASLDNLYASGDGCSSYGNRNMWAYFRDWFGSTSIFDPFGWDLMKTADDVGVYLVIGNTKRLVPTAEIFHDWKLSAKPVKTVSQALMDSIPTIPPLDRLGWYEGSFFYVDGGRKYWLANDELLKAWGQYDKRHLAAPAYQSLGSLPDGGPATFYTSNQGQISRMAGGIRYPIDPNYTSRWTPNPVELTSSAYTAMNTGATLDYRISINNTKFLVDNGRLLNVDNPVILRSYGQNSATFTPVANQMYIIPSEQAKLIIHDSSNAAWFMPINGQKYYLPSGTRASAWGASGWPTELSAALGQSIPINSGGESLPTVVKEQETGKIYLMDGSRHEATGTMLNAVQDVSHTIPTFSASDIAAVPLGSAISSPILRSAGTPHVYNMANGDLYHIPTAEQLYAFGYPRKFDAISVSPVFMEAFTTYRRTSMFVTSGSTTHFLQDGNAYPIGAGAVSDWVGGATPVNYTSAGFSSRFDVQGGSLGLRVRDNGTNLVISGGQATAVAPYNDAFDGGTPWTSLSTAGLPRNPQAPSYLVQSTNHSDATIWLMNQGKKHHILTSAQYFAYSLGGRQPIVFLSPAALAELPQVAAGRDPSVLVQKPGSGLKLLETDGSFFGFSDNQTVANFIQGNTIETLSPSIYDRFSVYRANTSRLLRNPDGSVYWVENGQKRWISTANAYNFYKASNPLTGVNYGITNWLPNGQALN